MQIRMEFAKELKSIIIKYIYSNIHYNKIYKLNKEYHSIFDYDHLHRLRFKDPYGGIYIAYNYRHPNINTTFIYTIDKPNKYMKCTNIITDYKF